MHTLETLRQTFINTYLGGKDKEDRKPQNKYIENILIQARAHMIEASGTFDVEWVQKVTVEMQKVVEETGSYYKSNTTVPQLINTANAGIYMIRSNQKNMYAEDNFEVQEMIKLMAAKHDRYTKHRTKVAILNGEMRIVTKAALGKNIEVYCVMYDPNDEAGFTAKSRFPYSGHLIPRLLELAFGLYLKGLQNAKEDENNSYEQTGQNVQQQRKDS